MVTEWQERLLLGDVLDGLAAALREAEREGRNVDQLDAVGLNKLVYLAVDEFEPPVTYTWSLHGASVCDPDVDVDRVLDAYEGRIDVEYEPSLGSESGDHPGESPRAYEEFFLHDVDLESLLGERRKADLDDFYRDYVPDAYEDLYVASAVVRRSLDAVARRRGLGEETPDVEAVLEELDVLVEAVAFHGELDRDVVDAVTRYADLLKDVLVTLPDVEAWDAGKRRAVCDVCSFFDDVAWRYVALRISEDTVEGNGPRWRSLLAGILDDVEAVASTYDEDLRTLERRCFESGIAGREFRRYASDADVVEDYSGRAEEDLDVVAEWEPASEEANEHLDG